MSPAASKLFIWPSWVASRGSIIFF
jgi:hypothetical protein